MGAWGTGLYSSDFASDLSDALKAVARLPFEPDRLLELLCEMEPAASNDVQDSDHTVFWLVVADQFAKRGIACSAARDQALSIITTGADLAAMRALGMDERSLKKRAAMLDELRGHIAEPADGKKFRKALKSPQKLLFDVGEVLCYPISKGKPINPYTVGKDWPTVKAWQQDGWGALVITERGLLFDFLAWYRPLVIAVPLATEPSLEELLRPHNWLLRAAGTLTAKHLAGMQFKRLGRISVDSAKYTRIFPLRTSPKSWVVNDISIANAISVGDVSADREAGRAREGQPPVPRIASLAEIT